MSKKNATTIVANFLIGRTKLKLGSDKCLIWILCEINKNNFQKNFVLLFWQKRNYQNDVFWLKRINI